MVGRGEEVRSTITGWIWASVTAGAMIFGAPFCWAETEHVASSLAEACHALESADFSQIEEAPAHINEAKFIGPKGSSPGYCHIRGYVWPQVAFELRLPVTNWNSRLLHHGCGGDCGALPDETWGEWCPLHRGYACVITDTGHEGSGLWAYYNPQAQIDFGYRAVHVATVAAKFIVQHFFGQAPQRAYFLGCSLGSQQGLVEAQRFPGDFDGIIGGGAWIGDIDGNMDFMWGARALRGADGKPLLSRAEMQRVHAAVLAKCDLDDGVKDGLIGNPLKCKFDPAELQCTKSKTTECLTSKQVGVVKSVYSGPTTSAGVRLSSGGPLLGSEHEWVLDPRGEVGVGEYIMSDGGIAIAEESANRHFRWLVQPAGGPAWSAANFDFDRDYLRFSNGARQSLINEGNPDLRKLNRAGGKLLLYVGLKEWSDPRRAIDYYETVERTMGGPSTTRDFFRLFLIPGANHCVGGEGPWAVDYLTYMENWVERGQPPDVLIGAHVDGSRLELENLRYPLSSDVPVTFTRPIYPYPLWAKYKGTGDPAKASSFKAVEP
jgi:hypothetical protein